MHPTSTSHAALRWLLIAAGSTVAACLVALSPAHAQDKVFEKFYSLARPHSRKKSTGLGLSFVREIASLHHGRIELVNAPEGGAIARLALPLSSG